MRTLTGSLSSEIGASTIQPAYALQITTGAQLCSPVTVTGAAGAAGRSAALLTQAGTLLVAVCPTTGSGSAQKTISVYRITSPTSAPVRSAAITVTTDADQIAGVALVQSGSTIRCFYQQYQSSGNPGHIAYRDSTNDGVTWSAETLINLTWPGGGHGYVYGIAPASTTDLHVAVAYSDPYGNAQYCRSQYSSSWSAWTSVGTTSQYGLLRGIRIAVDASNIQHIISGMQTRPNKGGISHTHYQLASGTYSTTTLINTQDTPALGLSYPYPTVTYDPTTGYLYTVVAHRDDGTVSGVPGWYTRIHRSTDGGSSWQLYSYLGTPFTYEASLVISGSTMLLTDGQTLYQQPAAAPATITASGDIVAMHITDTQNKPSTATITLDNSSGTYSALTPGCALTLKLGYGSDLITTHQLSVDSLSFDRAGPASTVTLHARCALRLWDIPCPKFLSIKSASIATLIADLAKEVGQPVAALPSTSQFSQVIACFAVSPGESFLTALERIATIFGFSFFADASGTLHVYDPQSSDTTAWAYGSEIYSSSIASSADQANVIQVIGATPSTAGTAPPFAYVIDSAQLQLYNVERMRIVSDKLLTSSAACQIRAAQTLAQEQRHATAAEIISPINPATELGDVISYAGSKYRIIAQQLAIELATATWTHTTHCTGM